VVVPRGRAAVLSVATPEPLRFTVPKTVGPAVNFTEPVGVAFDVTVAVNVTIWPSVDGFGDEVRFVAVVA